MKTAGIITMHNCSNYGAALQAYATQKNLESLDIKSSFINYTTPSDKKSKKLFLPPTSKGNIRHNLKNLLYPGAFIKRARNFDNFSFKHFNITKKEYTLKNFSELQKENFDFLITGSDQTFAINLLGDTKYREPFFLPFDFSAKKISYASSMGEKLKNLPSEKETWIKEMLLKYNTLSVREEKAKEYIKNLTNKDVKVIFDPTLTLSREDWGKIEEDIKVPEKYIFFYSVLPSQWVIEYVKKLSKETNLPVITSNPRSISEINTNFKRMDTASPSQFLSLIKNASMIVTSSFHGTIFSMIYEKPFASLIVGEGNRLSTLLTLADMEDFGFRQNEEIKIQSPDSEKIKHLLNKAQQTNKEYLIKAISE